MKTTATNKKVRELISAVSEGLLIPRPEFQRRLVWTRDDKNKFIDTVLQGFPFPEIYIADGEVNLETAIGTQMLVDGQQRVTTLVQYFTSDPSLQLTIVPPYKQLSPDDQKSFLSYDVAVRDIGSVSKEQIVEVFHRINATKYSLNDMEVNNAIYDGKLKKFAERWAASSFFEERNIFRVSDLRRMGDMRFVLSVVITMMEGYFNRDESFEAALARYNDEFPREEEIEYRLQTVFDFIDECGFERSSRLWKRSDLFSTIVELDQLLNLRAISLQPSVALERLEGFFSEVDNVGAEQAEGSVYIYSKAALQASNDRINRVRRGVIISSVLEGESPDETLRNFL